MHLNGGLSAQSRLRPFCRWRSKPLENWLRAANFFCTWGKQLAAQAGLAALFCRRAPNRWRALLIENFGALIFAKTQGPSLLFGR